MSNATVSELIQMYSSGVISREGLEREMRSWNPLAEGDVGAGVGRTRDSYLTLVPDSAGVWRLAA